MDWKAYFEMMVDWKKLPAYRAEPRIDSFVGYFLPKFIEEYLGDRIVGIIPELPIRLGTIKSKADGKEYSDKSYKVDFYLFGESGIHYFVEFKTDSGSRREKQDIYLSEAQEVGMAAIVDGIRRISRVTSNRYKDKYDHLLDKMTRIGIIDSAGNFSGRSEQIKIVYVQPSNKVGDVICIDFQAISTWLQQRESNDDFESYFAEAMTKWSHD